MLPTPISHSLSLCHLVIIDQSTRNPSVLSAFTNLAVDAFPAKADAFSVFASLTDALGEGKIELAVFRLETNEQVYSQKGTVTFPERQVVLNIHFRVRSLTYPGPGTYSFLVTVDGEFVCERAIRVELRKPE